MKRKSEPEKQEEHIKTIRNIRQENIKRKPEKRTKTKQTRKIIT